MTIRALFSRNLRSIAVVIVAVLAASTAGMTSARAQSDPYTEGEPNTSGSVRPGLSIDVTEANVGDEVRIQGCGFQPGAFVRITLNPGTAQNPGTPCPGAIRSGTAAQQCPFTNPGQAGPPDTTAGGGIAGTVADANGCVDVLVRVPDRSPGSYEVCTVSAGVETVCAALRIKGAGVFGQVFGRGGSDGDGTSGRDTSRGLARTGLMILPLLLLALIAILVGRWLLQRSRRHRTA
jgi:hypothetical protein